MIRWCEFMNILYLYPYFLFLLFMACIIPVVPCVEKPRVFMCSPPPCNVQTTLLPPTLTSLTSHLNYY